MKIVCIMPVWDEQNMIGLALASSKNFIYEYIIILQKGIDKTREVIEYCQKLWNLKITFLESDKKLRYKRNLMMNYAKKYADYYIIQDGDEIFVDHAQNEIYTLIENKVTFSTAPIVFLENDLIHTTMNEDNIMMVNHPFFFKNLPDIYFPEVGDMPWYNPQRLYHHVQHFQNPLKFDCKIKNYRRLFLREMFTPWHENSSEEMSLEEYCEKHHYHVKWFRENGYEITMEDVIERCQSNYERDKFRWNILYDENKYYKRPSIIQFFINKGKLTGIESMEELKLLKSV